MKIAIVSSWYTDVIGGSGTAVFFAALVNGLRDRGYTLDIITPPLEGDDYVQVTLQRFLFNAELRTDPRIRQADVVIGFDYDGYALDTQHGPPLITSAHAVFGDVLQWESEPVRTMVEAQAFFDRVAMHKARRVTIGSQYAKNRIAALYGVAPDAITVIPHGMLTPRWMYYLDAEPRRPNDHPVILSVGKMYPRKRTAVLLRALALLRRRFPRVELRVVGNGLEWDRLHALADELELQGNITWLSSITDDHQMAREWRQADIFAHPSTQETFGYVYLEAMQVGLPIVAVRSGAAPEVLGGAGMLVDPEAPDALADALERLITDESVRHSYVQQGRQRAEQFTHQKMIDGYVAVIESVMAGASELRRGSSR